MVRSFFCIAVAALTFGSSAALAQTAPSCTDEACFLEAVRACTPASFAPEDGAAIGAGVRYEVLNREGGACRIGFRFTDNPDPALADTPMSFFVTPEGASRETLLEAVESCLTGGAREGYECTGPLVGAFGNAGAAPQLTAGTGPMPCGQPVAEPAQDPLYPMPRDGKWGYVDRAGTWRIAPQWDRAGDFNEGRAMVGSPHAWGIIDRDGTFVVEMDYEGQSRVDIDGQRWVESPFTAYSEGCTVASIFTQTAQRPFFIDRQGNTYWRETLPDALAGRDIESFGPFSDGLAAFQEGLWPDARFGWVDAQGNVQIKAEFVTGGRFSNGLAPASAREGQAGFIAPDGQLQLPRKWTLEGAAPFSEGLARVWTGPFEVAFMNDEDFAFTRVTFGDGHDGFPEDATIEAAGDFHDGRAPVRAGSAGQAELVYVSPTGAVVFVPGATEGVALCGNQRLPEFHNGLVRLMVADAEAPCAATNVPGMAAFEDAHYVYLDSQGEIVLRQQK